MEVKLKDFVVDTKGHCFLCLSKISISDNSFKSTSSVYSFQYISHYLKISRRHVFDEKLPVPLALLAKVEKSLLMVSLCGECGALADKLSEQIKQLERLRMEVNDGVNRMKDKLDGALVSGAEGRFKGLAEGNSIEMEKVNIVQRLRAETVKKCSLKLERTQPRVRLKDAVKERRKRKLETIVGDGNENDPTRFLSVELNQPEIPSNSHRHQSLPSNCKSVFLNHETDESELRRNYVNYSCLLCKTVFANFPNFKRHFEGVHLLLRFTCDVCNESFTQRHPLRSHLRQVHPQRYQEYMKEEKKIDNSQDRRQDKKDKKISNWNNVPLTHRTSESEFRKNYLNYSCRLCNLANLEFSKFKRHYESVHLKLKFTCDICSAAYSDRPKLRTHLRIRHPEHYQQNERKRVKMEVVEKHTVSTDKTCVPLNFATDEDELRANFSGNTCLACHKVCQNYSNFKEHFEAIHLKLRFTCDSCNVGYSTRNKLKKHLIVHHPEYYREHYEIKSKDREQVQGVVTNRTPVPLNYEASESEIHPNYSNGACLLCNKMFTNYSNFKRHFESIHLRLHFTCDICNQGFSQRNNLRMHLLTNHPQRYQEYQSERTEVEVKTELVEMPVSTEDGDEESIVAATPQQITIPRVTQRKIVGNSRKCRKCNKYFASPLALWRHEGSVHLKVCSGYGRFPKLNGSDDEEDKEEKKRLRDEERRKRREGRDHFYYVAKEAKPEVELPFPCDKCPIKFRSKRGLKQHNDIVHLKAYAIGWQSRGWRKKRRWTKQIGVKGESSENQDGILDVAPPSTEAGADVNEQLMGD